MIGTVPSGKRIPPNAATPPITLTVFGGPGFSFVLIAIVLGVGLIGSSVERVSDGSRLVHDAGATMDEIQRAIQQVADLIGEISAATQQQSSGISEVNQAVSQLDQATQQNAALVEQASAASRALSDESAKLEKAVQVFRLAEVG